MILGALVDAGVPLTVMRDVVARLDVRGVGIEAEAVTSGAVRGARVRVHVSDAQPPRDWRTIRALLAASSLDEPVRAAAVTVFSALARAEAQAHGVTEESVHFHEVGGVDAIVDIVAACAGLGHLGVERVVAHPVAVGSGWVEVAHGLLPVPAPATANLLAAFKAPLRPDPPSAGSPGELLTPTGAAILGALAEWSVPSFAPERVAYGFGSRELPWPNALRLWIGETADDADGAETGELLLETNIDDMNPQFYEPLAERLSAAGALDVWLTPAIMKKGRPATIVCAIVPASRRQQVEDALFLESTTLGVRATAIDRTRAERRFVAVTTRWGDVRLKLRGWDGRVIGVMPEYDDCLRLSRDSGAPLREVWAEANRLGDVFLGQRWQRALSETGSRR
jgi:uncharacterized protein (TIGR00299 family) protein